MKEKMTFVAVDADNVGESIGHAVLANDTESLSSISNSINTGIQVFSQWAEYQGGKIISSGSDEAIFQVPVASIEGLEEVKQAYTDKTGFTVSIGIGENVSDAAKALIYAKMNGKDQIMDYTPEMERAMKESISGNLQEQADSDEDKIEGGVADDVDHEELPQDQLEEGTEHEKEHTEDEDIAEEIAADHLSESDDYYSDLEEMEDEDEAEEEMEEESEEESEEEMEDEADEADEAMEDMVDANSPAEEDIDLDGQPDMQEEHGELSPEEHDIDGDGDVEHEEAMAAEAGEEEEYSDDEDYSDEEVSEEELSDSIESEMEDEEMPNEETEMYPDGEEMPEGEEGFLAEEMEEESEEADHESLKSVIYESLQSFRQNRDFLESLSQENPELYNGLIYCLQAMIEMAKELGYGDMGQEEEMIEEAPQAQEEMEMEDDSEEEMEEESEEEDFENNFKKHEKLVGLLFKMRRVSQILGELNKADGESFEELKEKLQQKMKSKKKGSGKKRKPSLKKPSKDKKKNKQKKSNNQGSFCARSHDKMRSSGKDCRSNEDKNSPLCSARRKFNCRGKNEEKGAVEKSEKLSNFLKKKELSKGREGTATKQTTRHVSKPHNPEGTQKGYKVKVIDNETGKVRWVDGSRGLAKDPNGDPMSPDGKSPLAGSSQKVPKATKI